MGVTDWGQINSLSTSFSQSSKLATALKKDFFSRETDRIKVLKKLFRSTFNRKIFSSKGVANLWKFDVMFQFLYNSYIIINTTRRRTVKCNIINIVLCQYYNYN